MTGAGGPREVVSYTVPLLAPAAAPAKPRQWFGCPGCERKCSDLFLKAPRRTLACRTCHGLKYESQYRPTARARRGRR